MTLALLEPEDRSQAADAVLDAAARCFAERGFAATAIDDVARALGATKGRVYHHFASKTALFFAVYRRGMAIDFATVEPFAALPDPLERLSRMALAHAETIMREQAYQRVITEGVLVHRHGTLSPAERAEMAGLMALRDDYEALFRQAVEAVTGRDARLATKSFLAVLNSPVLWYSERDGGERAELARELTAFALAGLGQDLAAPETLAGELAAPVSTGLDGELTTSVSTGLDRETTR